jgi:hypothetical protein
MHGEHLASMRRLISADGDNVMWLTICAETHYPFQGEPRGTRFAVQLRLCGVDFVLGIELGEIDIFAKHVGKGETGARKE